ncbi:MAG: hypothetical protein LBG06_07750 [Deltaproteobacteria bacterium]|jgi:hypothetical protein|nr:hypothetical protein [Deltaproteobacteria bacterium]
MTAQGLEPFRRSVVGAALPAEWAGRARISRHVGPTLADDLRRLASLPRLLSSPAEAAAAYALKGVRPVSDLHFELAEGSHLAVTVQPSPMPGDGPRNGHASLMSRVRALSSAVYCHQTRRSTRRSKPPGFHLLLVTGFRILPPSGTGPFQVFSMRTPEGLLFPGSHSLAVLELPSATGIRPAGDAGPSQSDDIAFFIANAHLEDRKGQIMSLCDRREELKLAFYELPSILESPDVKGVVDYMAEMDLQNAERIIKSLRDAAADERESQLRVDLVLDLHRAGLPVELIISVSRLPADDVYSILNRRSQGAMLSGF